jgi:hypothetical protein
MLINRLPGLGRIGKKKKIFQNERERPVLRGELMEQAL